MAWTRVQKNTDRAERAADRASEAAAAAEEYALLVHAAPGDPADLAATEARRESDFAALYARRVHEVVAATVRGDFGADARTPADLATEAANEAVRAATRAVQGGAASLTNPRSGVAPQPPTC